MSIKWAPPSHMTWKLLLKVRYIEERYRPTIPFKHDVKAILADIKQVHGKWNVHGWWKDYEVLPVERGSPLYINKVQAMFRHGLRYIQIPKIFKNTLWADKTDLTDAILYKKNQERL